jgi:predicted DNA-binding transcriptional regulator AlpA
MLRILRKRQVCEYIPVGETKLEEEFIKTGRLKKIPLGERAYGFAEDNVQEVIRELIAAANTDEPKRRR